MPPSGSAARLAIACLLLAGAGWAKDAPQVPIGAGGSGGDERNGTKGSSTVGGKIGETVEGALKEEFREEVEEAERDRGRNFNETAHKSDAQLETVVKVPRHKAKVSNDSLGVGSDGSQHPLAESGTNSAAESSDGNENDVDRIIDSQDNVFILSTPQFFAALTLDPRLIKDLTILITTAAVTGMLFEAVGQPVINGYLIAGAMVGPGGLALIKELVQVESLSQLGVQFLLFYLGMEFSFAKMRVVGGVALIGGVIEGFIFVGAAASLATAFGGPLAQGIFLGALISMSSTSVVVKVLEAGRATASQHGQITIGTLILQDCTVGVMFAMMPILSGKHGADDVQTAMAIAGVLAKPGFSVAMAVLLARTVLPHVVRLLTRHASPDLFQVVLIALCLMSAWTTGWLGLSEELGAFMAGAMLSSVADHREAALRSVDGARNVFTTLFLTSIGLVMSPTFLWEHLWFLALGLAAVFACKVAIVAAVVAAFRFDFKTALMVGLNLAQISEFAFVLLSVAIDLALIEQEMYLMLIGVTALSLLITPAILPAARWWLFGLNAAPEDKLGSADPLREEESISEPGLAEDEESLFGSGNLQTIQRRNKSGVAQLQE
ncbi:unnamed protein product [Ostreobium quekettii]|uniref:Cation/H+ exchanger transmembrane domain-containing protein n=1 Tax=Ostreobium quekettii TaxID=121088 RepID=A0A8S1IXH2_9CHLO|nr:unnamed protein product [Ostreobium quekettii]